MDANYAAALRRDGLKGARLGVLHQAYDTPTLDNGGRRRVPRRARRAAEPRRRGDRSRGRRRARCLAADAGRRLQPVQVRPQPLPRRRSATRRRCIRSTRSSSRDASTPRFRRGSSRAQASDDVPGETAGCRSRDEFREKLRAAVLTLMDRPAARRADLSDVEQPAAPHRRPQHAGRRQQPVLLAEHRVPGDYRADGIHARRYAARRPAVLRTAVERGDAAPPGVRVRAGHAPSAAADAALTN